MITKDNNLKVMALFFKQPFGEFHIRKISKLTGLSTTGIIKILKKLKKEKLLTSKKMANLEQISPDFDGNFYFMKRLYNIYSLQDLTNFLKKYYEMPQAIIVFGSYSDGTDIEKSDIDIAIILNNEKKIPELNKFEIELERNINIHQIVIKNSSNEFRNSLANGIILHGYAELIK